MQHLIIMPATGYLLQLIDWELISVFQSKRHQSVLSIYSWLNLQEFYSKSPTVFKIMHRSNLYFVC